MRVLEIFEVVEPINDLAESVFEACTPLRILSLLLLLLFCFCSSSKRGKKEVNSERVSELKGEERGEER